MIVKMRVQKVIFTYRGSMFFISVKNVKLQMMKIINNPETYTSHLM
jgi:hypothetical protein